MRHGVATTTQEIWAEMYGLAADVEIRLHLASPAARTEWVAFRSQWPSVEDIKQGTTQISNDTAEAMRDKARRFCDILRSLPEKLASENAGSNPVVET